MPDPPSSDGRSVNEATNMRCVMKKGEMECYGPLRLQVARTARRRTNAPDSVVTLQGRQPRVAIYTLGDFCYAKCGTPHGAVVDLGLRGLCIYRSRGRRCRANFGTFPLLRGVVNGSAGQERKIRARQLGGKDLKDSCSLFLDAIEYFTKQKERTTVMIDRVRW